MDSESITDHTGPHGRCAVNCSWNCPDVHYSATRGWYCECCDGEVAFGDLEAADMLIYGVWKRRLRQAMYKHDHTPLTLLGPAIRRGDL